MEERRGWPDHIYTVRRVLRLGIVLVVWLARLGWRLLSVRLTRGLDSWQSLLGRSLAELCEDLGTTYIKIGQLLSTRYDLIPEAVLKPLERLQDQVAPFDSRHVPAILAAQLGQSPSAVFAHFEPQPISSASVACVYRATLHTGETVAVKIRRPAIARMVRADLWLLRAGARLAGKLPMLRDVPMAEVVEELGASIEQQLDFYREAENNRRFRAYFSDEQRIRIPRLCEEFCSESVLVMEFMPDLVRLDELRERGIDCRESVLTGLRALYQMIFVDGFIHCDLHPGNVYFQPNGDVTLLDMGFVKELRGQDRLLFTRFFRAIALNRGKECARIMYDMALSLPPTFERERFERAVSTLIAQSSGVQATDFQVATFAMQLFDIQRHFRLRSTPNFVMAIVSLLVFEGIVKTYYAELDFQREAMPFLIKGFFSPVVASR